MKKWSAALVMFLSFAPSLAFADISVSSSAGSANSIGYTTTAIPAGNVSGHDGGSILCYATDGSSGSGSVTSVSGAVVGDFTKVFQTNAGTFAVYFFEYDQNSGDIAPDEITLTRSVAIGTTFLRCVTLYSTSGHPIFFDSAERITQSAAATMTVTHTLGHAGFVLAAPTGVTGNASPDSSNIQTVLFAFGSTANTLLFGSHPYQQGAGSFTFTVAASTTVAGMNVVSVSDYLAPAGYVSPMPALALSGTSTTQLSSVAAVGTTVGSVWDSYWPFAMFGAGLSLAFIILDWIYGFL
jgi:hypothetical protein